MNKIFKSKWNVATQSYVACSELTRRASKTTVGVPLIAIASALALSPTAHAVDCVPEADGRYVFRGIERCDTILDTAITLSSDLLGKGVFIDINSSSGIDLLNVGNINFTGNTDTNQNGTASIGSLNGHGIIHVYNSKTEGTINIGDITANVQGGEGADLISTSSRVNINVKNLNAVSKTTVVRDNTRNANWPTHSERGAILAHGVFAGSDYYLNSDNRTYDIGKFSTVTIGNMSLDQTVEGGNPLPGLNTGLLATQGGMRGRVWGTSGRIIINEQLNMYLKGEHIEGIYASGSGINSTTGEKAVSTIELNNSNIIAESNGPRFADNTAIKVGRYRINVNSYRPSYTHNSVNGEGVVVSKGILNVDASKLNNGAGITLHSSNSLFEANLENSRTNLLANTNAILVSPRDYGYLPRVNDNITALLKNASLNTASNDASLIKVHENQTNTNISISGDDSIAVAAQNGWLLEVGARIEANETDSGSESTVSGSTTANFTGGKYFGLTTLSDTERANPSSLTINLEGANTKWYLANKSSENKATFTTLNIAEDATVDATGVFTPSSKIIELYDGKIMIVADSANITETVLTEDKAFVLKGESVNNNGGIINLANTETSDLPSFTNTLKIDTNYTATSNARVKMNTGWNAPGSITGADSKSDLLHITGTATGVTKVIPVGKNGSENVINGSIKQIVNSVLNTVPVVKVYKDNKGGSFVGTAQTTGAGEAQLTSRDNNGVREYYWTIAALPEPVKPADPVKPAEPNKPIIPIYNPTVPAYTLAAKAGLELGYTTLATLHERRGENQTLAWDECGTCGEKADGQSWARVFGKDLELSGKYRLDADHRIYGFQLGHDFAIKRTDEGGHRLTGAYVSYGVMKSDYFDRYRAVNGVVSADKFTATGKQYGWNLGLTHTRYAPNGAYVDLVGQIGFLRNKYHARNGVEAKQRGTALALSVEVGRPYALAEHKISEGVWMIEPQAQLVYQALKLNNFNDGIRQIQGETHHGLRGRVGVRLAYNTQASEDKYRTNTVYAIANILQDLKGGKAVSIGLDQVKEVNSKTWVEVGVGGQLPVGKQSYLYADARYERNLGGAKREGYRGTVGFKYTWK